MVIKNDISIQQDAIEQQFAIVDSIIAIHHSSAIANVNIETLLTCWEILQYISFQMRNANWGNNVVGELADYLKRINPQRRGYSRRNLYNMVKFYETYNNAQFTTLTQTLPLSELVQLPTAQTKASEFVQLPTAQIMAPLPAVLSVTTFTNHVEILNRCRTNEERVFYMLYAAQNRLKAEELRRCIVSQTYSSLMSKEKMMSPLLKGYSKGVDFMLKDKAVVDFLNLPRRYNEHHLHKGILEHMKEFILELGKDFLFVDSEFPVEVGGKSRRIDLLFFHRALQCLVAIELKAVDFEPEFVGKMDMYLEALDRDIKRDNENPSIGIILCPSADRSAVEYTLSRSLSPTMVAEYQRKLIPQEVMKRSLEEYCSFLMEQVNH